MLAHENKGGVGPVSESPNRTTGIKVMQFSKGRRGAR